LNGQSALGCCCSSLDKGVAVLALRPQIAPSCRSPFRHRRFPVALRSGSHRSDAISVLIRSSSAPFEMSVSQCGVKVPNNTVVMTRLTASEADIAPALRFNGHTNHKHERRCLTWQHHDGHEFVKRWPNLVRNSRAVGRSRADFLRHLQGSRPAVRRRRLSAVGGKAEIH
jgi:hypothetical protein